MLAIKLLWILGCVGFRSVRLLWRAGRQLGMVLWREA
jgi:hypothetical protein